MTPFPRTAFKALVASILNCPPAYVVWQGDVEPSFGKPAGGLLWASCRIASSSRTTVGCDDLRQTDNGDGTYVLDQVGRRELLLGFQLFLWGPPGQFFADDYMDLLHTRIWQPNNLDTLNGMGLVLVTNGPVLPLPTTINSRYISAAHADLTVALANQDVATVPGGNQTIHEIIGTGTLTTEGGGTATVTTDWVEGMPKPPH